MILGSVDRCWQTKSAWEQTTLCRFSISVIGLHVVTDYIAVVDVIITSGSQLVLNATDLSRPRVLILSGNIVRSDYIFRSPLPVIAPCKPVEVTLLIRNTTSSVARLLPSSSNGTH